MLAAGAHPFGARFAAHRLQVEVGPDELVVDYSADLPDRLYRTERRGDPIAELRTELEAGILALVDGQPVPLTRRTAGAPQRTSEHTTAMDLRWTGPLPPGRSVVEIQVSNGNLPDVPAYSSAFATVRGGVFVRRCSLLREADGAVVRDDSGRWRTGDAARVVSLTVQRPVGLRSAWLWLAPAPEHALPASQARPPGLRDVFRGRAVTPGLVAGALLAAVVASAGGPDDRRGRIGAALALVAAGLLGALTPETWAPWLDLVAAVVLVGGALATRTQAARPIVAVAAAAGCAVGLHALGPALVVAIAAGLVALLAPRSAAGAVVVAPIAAAVAMALLLRATAGLGT